MLGTNVFFKNETVNCWKKLKDIALGLILMIRKPLIEIIVFLPPEYSETRCVYVFDKSGFLISNNEKATNLIPVPPFMPSRMCA